MARIITFEGRQHSFPDDATDEEIAAALEGAAPALASQADVRKAEPRPTPMNAQREKEARFEAARQIYLKANGVLPKGKPQAQAIEDASGIQDPTKTREKAEVEHLAETGEVTYGDSGLYNVAKPAAALLGAAGGARGGFTGGVAGATGAEALVRLTALAYNLNKAVQSGAIDDAQAQNILLREAAKGSAEDLAFNAGVPLIGKLAMKIPGVPWLVDLAKTQALKAGQAMGLPVGAPALPAPSAKDLKLADRQALTDDPAKKQAITELGQRLPPDRVMTPGQVTDMPGVWESNVRRGQPRQFDVLDKEMETAADKLLRETTTPAGVPEIAPTVGAEIQALADSTQKAVKARLRPAFDAADRLGVAVDLRPVRVAVSKALLADSKVPGGMLAPAEREQLNSIFEDLRLNSNIGAEQALDFISRRKEQLRATTADWKPSAAYDKLIGDLTKEADTAYARAAGGAGKGDVVKGLLDAQRDYKEMMGTVYDDAIKAALKKNPEDVGRFLWSNGNVSEPQQLQRLLSIAKREGAANAPQAEALTRSVARGFLQEAVPNIEAAAKWSQTLKESPAKRRTWEELTSAPAGKEFRNTMEVIEQAAQMALNKNIVMGGGTGLAARAGSGTMGTTSSKVHPGVLVSGLTYVAGMKAAATAYTHGDKGMLNTISQVLRADMAGIGAAKSVQEANARLQAYMKANNITTDEAE